MSEPKASAFDLPKELQEIIFKTAARSDSRCALNLLKTAQYVHDWIYPILYERVVLGSPASAKNLLRTLRRQYTHPPVNYALKRGLGLPKPLSMTLSSDISLTLAKPLLAQLSKSLITYTIFRKLDNSDNALRFVRSPYLRRIILVYTIQNPESTQAPVPFPEEEDIPYTVLSTVTHLALVSDHVRCGWSLRNAFQVAASLVGQKSPSSPFANLTCFAICWQRWRETSNLVVLHAKKLRCFAILGPSNVHTDARFRQKTLNILRSRTKDPRFVLVGHGGYGDPGGWRVEDGYRPSRFWDNIEQLVKEHYLCDDGEKWNNSIVTSFRLKQLKIGV